MNIGKALKKYFIPHKHNDYKPHMFREFSVLMIFSLIVIIFIVSIGSTIILDRTSLTALVLPKVLVDYANQDRFAGNLGQLKINPILEKAAQMKADDMAAKSYFAHKSPDGHSPWYWFEQAGYDFSYAGENLAVNFSDSVDVNQAWMNSPGHRENILNGNFTEIGIATARGTYQGRDTIFVVQLFGRPAIEAILTPVVSTPVKSPKPSVTSAKPTTTPIVLAEATSANDLFISAAKPSAPTVLSSTDTTHSTLFERTLVSPNKSLRFAYFIISSIILLGLILAVFIEIRNQHPRVIFMALGLICVICGFLYLSQSVVFGKLLIV